MKHTHPGTENLFERLFRFSPRQGEKRARLPLEDYTTEAIAFFFLQSEQFRGRFFSEILKVAPPEGALQISTQSVDDGFDGRADMVIFSEETLPNRIGIEVKLGAKFQELQLERMRVGFPDSAYLLAPAKFLQNNAPYVTDNEVKPAALETLERVCRACTECKEDLVGALLLQFSDFLANRGFASLEISTHPMNTKSLTEFARLLDDWSALMIKLRSELGLERSGQWSIPRWEGKNQNWPETSFYGIHGTNGYVGLSIGPKNDVELYYEESRDDINPAAPTPEGLVRGSDGKVYCTLTAPYPDPQENLSEELLMQFRKLQQDARAALDQWVTSANSMKASC